MNRVTLIFLVLSIVSTYYATEATIALYKGYPRSESFRLVKLFVRVLIPALLMAVPIVTIQVWTTIETIYSLWQLLILVPVGVVTYVGTLYVIYRKGLNELVNVVKMR